MENTQVIPQAQFELDGKPMGTAPFPSMIAFGEEE